MCTLICLKFNASLTLNHGDKLQRSTCYLLADLNASTTDMNLTAQYGSIVPRVHSESMRIIYIYPGKALFRHGVT